VTQPPPRLARALAGLRRWREDGLHLVGVRHHSPGCAEALGALLADVRPRRVLVEGPREHTALLDELDDDRTVPPVAILSTDEHRAAFYPLAAHSPEWVALRWGLAHGAVVDFIDQPFALQSEESDAPGVRTLQAEYHLARSASIAALARRLGCRDHDEVWEHLFEVRDLDAAVSVAGPGGAGWRDYLDDVFAWGALARLDAEREVLDADGTHAREAAMTAMIERHRDGGDGPIVVVTGAFHTLGLLDVLDGTPEASWVTAHDPGDLDLARPAWLIRYDNTRLDALRGYGAGMPAPGWWERVWRMRRSRSANPEAASRAARPGTRTAAARGTAHSGRELVVEVVLDVVGRLREAGEPVGAAVVQATAEQALRLAELRGHAWPGRTDVLDAMLSCLVQDEAGFTGHLAGAIAAVFGGSELGEVPPGTAAPPLVADVRDRAQRLRFVVADSTTRTVTLDTARRPAHVRRREFLATLAFCGFGFGRQTGGADLVAGTGLGMLHEEWQYAWTPLVEAALVAASDRGPTLDAVVRATVGARLEDAPRDSAVVARLVTELLVMGALDQLGPVLARLGACYDTDPSLTSIVTSLHRLAALVGPGGGRLDIKDHAPGLRALLTAGLAAVAYRLGDLPGLDPDALPGACDTLVSLRGLLVRLASEPAADPGSGDPGLADSGSGGAAEAVRRELRRLRTSPDTPARLRGCLVGLAHCDGESTLDELCGEIAGHLHAGADPDRVAGFLLGLMQSAPDLILHTTELLSAVDAALTGLSDDAFLRVLPDLRQAFTWLKPMETHRLATHVAALRGGSAAALDQVSLVDEATALAALRIEHELIASLVRDGLGDWAVTTEAVTP
jgi:hypothetical protein